MPKIFRTGAVGAMLDEYERAALELQSLLREIGEDEFTRIADAETLDEDCRSIQTVSRHVVMAGYSYANYIRAQFSIPAEPVPREIISHAEIGWAIDKMLAYTGETLDGKWEMTEDEISKIVINSSWGVTYDLEQLLEHAIVHVLRHRRQIEKFLVKFEFEKLNRN
ncbi:MAG TPA: DinB family protein [Pyrinomonadaceae bacterium]|jgi:uncharacterized damage-inducible protein DinB